MPTFAGWVRDTRGTSAVEFAILTPVFLLLLTGMLAYGIYFSAANSIQQLAADAARTAIAGLDDDEREKMVKVFLDANANIYGLIERDRLDENVRSNPDDSNQYIVELTYDASDLPIWNLYPPLPLPSQWIVHTSTIRRGGI